ncbi:GNAT family N-acetyltransferase [Mucilaginibacter lappiensis]|uniref:GNAT family N-acyltransferase n=1 Tax=Mucilaginibacter lappiensis TaxID=354630 RepID=A0A1N6WVH4_9SPHI|nr:GNAT family N-acetyltransferase [Mucilaginibacter lappiensis]MBB6109470.1 putative GNAT family N-acyltransferase [Mucilaginibacter lappiensis]MBB6127708.1 putative GNAT family N-acyltransferase [Mucilaginibacter lappiensis]SIQ94048.1 Predicted N-acyltransferase, GNAT family [Mucilaginibacter lappiensis]
MPTNSNLEVRKVTEQTELDKVFAVRREVFVVEQNCPPELEWEFEDESTHFLATINGEPAGACRWRKTDKGYKLERFAVLKKFRGHGIGQALVKTVLDDLPADAEYVYMHAQTQAVSLYERFSFEKTGPEFEEAGIWHYKMIRK